MDILQGLLELVVGFFQTIITLLKSLLDAISAFLSGLLNLLT